MTLAAMRRVALAGFAAVAAVPAWTGSFDEQRLFTTAEQRARIDGDGAEPSVAAGQQARPSAGRGEGAAAQDRHSLVLKGIVRRPDAPAIFWIGERRFQAGQALPAEWPARRGRIDDAGVVLTLGDGRELRLEPGEALELHAPLESPDAR